jgi:hypothetical protein
MAALNHPIGDAGDVQGGGPQGDEHQPEATSGRHCLGHAAAKLVAGQHGFDQERAARKNRLIDLAIGCRLRVANDLKLGRGRHLLAEGACYVVRVERDFRQRTGQRGQRAGAHQGGLSRAVGPGDDPEPGRDQATAGESPARPVRTVPSG